LLLAEQLGVLLVKQLGVLLQEQLGVLLREQLGVLLREQLGVLLRELLLELQLAHVQLVLPLEFELQVVLLAFVHFATWAVYTLG
jgi:hypothetical protein